MFGAPFAAWVVALVVTTLYGFIMHRRGQNVGNADASTIIAEALVHSGVMQPNQLLKYVELYEEYLDEQETE